MSQTNPGRDVGMCWAWPTGPRGGGAAAPSRASSKATPCSRLGGGTDSLGAAALDTGFSLGLSFLGCKGRAASQVPTQGGDLSSSCDDELPWPVAASGGDRGPSLTQPDTDPWVPAKALCPPHAGVGGAGPVTSFTEQQSLPFLSNWG